MVMVAKLPFIWDREQVIKKMRRIDPEPIQEHLVEIEGRLYPPKQVVDVMYRGQIKRTDFTTQEAQRALMKVDLVCRRATQDDRKKQLADHLGLPLGDDDLNSSDAGVEQQSDDELIARLESRVVRLENALTTAQAAIAGLVGRLDAIGGRA